MIVIFLVLILLGQLSVWCIEGSYWLVLTGPANLCHSCSVSSSSMLIIHTAPALGNGTGRETNVQFHVLMFLCEKGHITILDKPPTRFIPFFSLCLSNMLLMNSVSPYLCTK